MKNKWNNCKFMILDAFDTHAPLSKCLGPKLFICVAPCADTDPQTQIVDNLCRVVFVGWSSNANNHTAPKKFLNNHEHSQSVRRKVEEVGFSLESLEECARECCHNCVDVTKHCLMAKTI